MSDRERSGDRPNSGLAAVAVVAVGVACCGGAPLALAALSSLAIGAILGLGGGVVALAALTALVIVRARRRRACAPGRITPITDRRSA